MNNFRRSAAGKTIAFLLCIVSMTVFFAGTASTLYLALNQSVYSLTKEENLYYTLEGQMEAEAEEVAYQAIYNRIAEWKELYYGTDEVVSDDSEVYNTDTYQDSYYLYTWTDEEAYVSNEYNLIYKMTDLSSGTIIGRSERNMDTAGDNLCRSAYFYGVTYSGNSFDITEYSNEQDAAGECDGVFVFDCELLNGLPELDIYHTLFNNIDFMYSIKYLTVAAAVAGFLLALFFLVNLMCVSGRVPDDNEVHDRFVLPLDVSIILMLILAAVFIMEVYQASFGSTLINLLTAISFVVGEAIIIWFFMSLALRVKTKTLLKNNVIYMIGAGISRMSPVNSLVVSLVIGIFFEIIFLAVFGLDSFWLLLLYLIEKAVMIPVLIRNAMSIARLKESGSAIADGRTDYRIDTKGLHGVYRKQAEDLNNISKGMELAVDEKVRADRMKTELITNVSHDIKTPLTSIVNYTGLIMEAESGNETTREYCEVLLRQSNRLKRLIEDLVEASRASTGNLDVELVPSDACILMVQASGDYDEKLEKAGLSIVLKVPEDPVMIMADGRRMWRIFDNLMNNICKYAQENTRVYMSLEKIGGEAVITFKNTSRDALDITEEELMERFVRGDRSRNTDGNGLGLSIAKSLAELQNGSLTVDIDGDLFKAILKFPVIEEETEKDD